MRFDMKNKQVIRCSRSDAELQIRLCLDALPLEEKGFSPACIAHMIAEHLFLLSLGKTLVV